VEWSRTSLRSKFIRSKSDHLVPPILMTIANESAWKGQLRSPISQGCNEEMQPPLVNLACQIQEGGLEAKLIMVCSIVFPGITPNEGMKGTKVSTLSSQKSLTLPPTTRNPMHLAKPSRSCQNG